MVHYCLCIYSEPFPTSPDRAMAEEAILVEINKLDLEMNVDIKWTNFL